MPHNSQNRPPHPLETRRAHYRANDGREGREEGKEEGRGGRKGERGEEGKIVRIAWTVEMYGREGGREGGRGS